MEHGVDGEMVVVGGTERGCGAALETGAASVQGRMLETVGHAGYAPMRWDAVPTVVAMPKANRGHSENR